MHIDIKKRTVPTTAASTDLAINTPEAAMNLLQRELDKRKVRFDVVGPNDLCIHFEDGDQRIGAFIDAQGTARYQELFGEAGMDLQHTLDWIGSGRKML